MIHISDNKTELSKEDQRRLQFINAMDYQAKFMLDPDIQGDVDFSHFDKNLAITNLKLLPKYGINEPELARAMLRAFHTLNNPSHYKEKTKEVLIGYNETKREDGAILRTPIYEEVKIQVSNFPKTFHKFRCEFLSLTNTSASRDGFRMKASRSNILVKEETLKDKTDVKNRWQSFGRKQQNNY